MYDKYHVKFLLQIFFILLLKGCEIFRICDQHSIETVTLSKYVALYKYMRK